MEMMYSVTDGGDSTACRPYTASPSTTTLENETPGCDHFPTAICANSAGVSSTRHAAMILFFITFSYQPLMILLRCRGGNGSPAALTPASARP
jgi:hypothetical protein